MLHTAVVLDDAPLEAMTADHLARAWHPKVTGLLNLHHATEGLPLDWLVIFSSMSALLGNPGQANHAVAGSWVDAFARWRHDQGLPTLSVNWGAWGEAGRATDFAARGFDTISTADGFAALTALLRHQRVNTGVLDYQPELLFRAFPRALDNPLLADLSTSGTSPRTVTPPPDLRAAQPGPARARMAQDAVAFTRRLRSDLDVPVSPAEVWAHPSPAELAGHIDSSLEALAGTRETDPRTTACASLPARRRLDRRIIVERRLVGFRRQSPDLVVIANSTVAPAHGIAMNSSLAT